MSSSGGDSSLPVQPEPVKQYRIGTHRLVPPARTLENMRPHMSKMGITRLANVTGLDRVGIPVVMAMRPNSRSVAVSQGKGLDLDAAKASALMEALETWHAERVDLPMLYGSYHDLKADWPLVSTESLPATRKSRFSPDLRLLWVESQDLATGDPVWLPFEMVHSDYTSPTPPGHGCFPCSTNGLASGNNLAEAQCHAICEVIERDATALLHCLSSELRNARRLDLDSVDDPECRTLLTKMRDAELEMVVWDTTSDIAIPSFYGFLLPKQGALEHLGAGAGTHPSRAIALSRTLTEAVQTRLTYISGARDDLLADEFSLQGIEEKLASARKMVGNRSAARSFASIPTYENDVVSQDMRLLLECLMSAGIERVCSVDLSKPGMGVSVVRIVIPKLEAPHDDESYLPGPRALAAEGSN